MTINRILLIIGCAAVGVLAVVLGMWLREKQLRKRDWTLMTEVLDGISNTANLLVLLYTPKTGKTEFISESSRWMFGMDKKQIEESVYALFDVMNFEGNESFMRHFTCGVLQLSEEKEYTLTPFGRPGKMYVKLKGIPCGRKNLLIVQDASKRHLSEEALYSALDLDKVQYEETEEMLPLNLFEVKNENPSADLFQNPWDLFQKKKKEEEEPRFAGKRALIVDDNDENCQMVCKVLQDKGVITEVANDGAEAVKKFQESEEGYYDLLFMDIQMPVMDGNEAAVKIRALERKDAKVVPIVAMTAYLFIQDIRSSQRAGMDSHIAKPISEKRVEHIMYQYL